MKNWNLWFLAAILSILYFGNSMIQSIKEADKKVADQVMLLRAEAQAISTKLSTDEKEKAMFYKLQKNQDVWNGTGCAQCHNTIELSLPMRKISVSEAMQIVRQGNEKTLAAGMPTYTSRASRDKNSITDADLKVRLDALYVKDFLDYAESKSHQ